MSQRPLHIVNAGFKIHGNVRLFIQHASIFKHRAPGWGRERRRTGDNARITRLFQALCSLSLACHFIIVSRIQYHHSVPWPPHMCKDMFNVAVFCVRRIISVGPVPSIPPCSTSTALPSNRDGFSARTRRKPGSGSQPAQIGSNRLKSAPIGSNRLSEPIMGGSPRAFYRQLTPRDQFREKAFCGGAGDAKTLDADLGRDSAGSTDLRQNRLPGLQIVFLLGSECLVPILGTLFPKRFRRL